MAIIYQKEINRPLSEINIKEWTMQLSNFVYKILVWKENNCWSIQLVKIIIDGFQFVKGKSQSKKDLKDYALVLVAKCSKLSQSFQENRIHEIEEDIRDLNNRIEFKYVRPQQ